jgi:hypothetical protein
METQNTLTVTIVPACGECLRRWLPGSTDRWRAEFIDDGPDEVLLFWCSECWLREFGAH